MKKITLNLAIFGLFSFILFEGCKKKTEEPTETVPDSTSGSDSRDAQSENDAAMNDVNDVMSNNSKVSGKGVANTEAQGVTGSICGLTVDSLLSNTGVMKLNYDGTTCNNRSRTGSIRLTLQNYAAGERWKDVGAVIKVDYINYKIVRASDQKSIMFNGTQYLTNVSGGNWINLIWLKNQTSLVTTVTGTNLVATFTDNKTANYNINRRFTYTYPGTQATGFVLTAKCEGIGTSGTLNNLENYGTTRDGAAFTSQVTTPIVWNMTCGGAVIQGEVNVKVATKVFDLTFVYGVDVSGNPVTVGVNQCPYGWKLEWTFNGNSKSKVIGYY